MEQYSFEQDESDIKEVEESYDSSGTDGIEPLDVDIEFNSPNNSSTPKEELSTLGRGCGRQSGQAGIERQHNRIALLGKRKQPSQILM